MLWFRKNRGDLYRPGERLIYSYFNGQKIVRADPLRLYKRVMEYGPELSINLKVAKSPMKDADKCHTDAVKRCREIFDVKPVEDGGLTELETIDLLDHFLLYTQALKKNTKNSPTDVESPSLLASEQPTDASQPTANLPDSGSTASASSTAPPEPSPTVPPSPLAASTPAWNTTAPTATEKETPCSSRPSTTPPSPESNGRTRDQWPGPWTINADPHDYEAFHKAAEERNRKIDAWVRGEDVPPQPEQFPLPEEAPEQKPASPFGTRIKEA